MLSIQIYISFNGQNILLLQYLVQDLSILNRDPARVLYVSGHALETTLQPENAVPIKPWKGDTEDTELLDIIPFLECELILHLKG